MPDNPYTTALDLLQRPDDPASADRALAILQAETVSRPADANAWFELADALDFLGREAEALPHYEKALALGTENLPPDDRPRLFIQLGSTLRNLKRYEEAKEVLEEGVK